LNEFEMKSESEASMLESLSFSDKDSVWEAQSAASSEASAGSHVSSSNDYFTQCGLTRPPRPDEHSRNRFAQTNFLNNKTLKQIAQIASGMKKASTSVPDNA
jgi:hypothetical protein